MTLKLKQFTLCQSEAIHHTAVSMFNEPVEVEQVHQLLIQHKCKNVHYNSDVVICSYLQPSVWSPD